VLPWCECLDERARTRAEADDTRRLHASAL